MAVKAYRTGCIYCIENTVNSKKYYGQTLQRPEARWYIHIYSADKGCSGALQRAIRKYGVSNFQASVVLRCTEPLLNAAEQHFIRSDNTMSPSGYNLTSGGDSGGTVSQATRGLHSRQLKGRVFSKEHRAHCCEAQRRRYEDPKEHEKTSKSAIRRFEKPEEREKTRQAALKQYEKPGAIEKARQITLGWFKNSKNRKKFIAACNTPEHCKRISEGVTKAWANKPFEERSAAAKRGCVTRRINALKHTTT